MGLEDISKRVCRTWNPKALLPKSLNDGTINNDYAQCSRLYRGVASSLSTNLPL